MITLVSFVLVLVGSLNWLSIGMLQFDFVAGIFGSQANLFSRVVYVIIGVAAIWLVVKIIMQKGKLWVSSKNKSENKIIDGFKDMVNKKEDDQKQQTSMFNNNHQNEQEKDDYNPAPDLERSAEDDEL